MATDARSAARLPAPGLLPYPTGHNMPASSPLARGGALDQVHAVFAAPPAPWGPIPFWFWNDDLDREELRRQLRAFAAAGCGGVLPHARVGLSRRVGYLTDTFLALVRDVVEACAGLGLRVILYDEASYPSGSACGAVVAADADHASRAIGLWENEIDGPARGYWRPNTGRALRDRHVASCAGRLTPEGRIDAATVRLLVPAAHDVIPYALPEGRWKLMSVWSADSGGHIRGAFADQESGSATAPAAGDILNPDAVASFLRLTHERYREAVGDHFGAAVLAMFTDEPGVFGKSPRRPADPRPYTPGFVDWLARRWGEDPRPWLPALWLDYGPDTEAFRRRYADAVQSRLHEVFYAAQSRWCARHGLGLTGHPATSNDMASLRAFHLPGQDMVWRWVLPGSESARQGPHAVAPKAATSAARRAGARRILTEVCGAYGWRLTLDEVKWLFDWHLVRGNNLICPHAFFYSIRGRRAWESEPDLGLHNVWWPHISHLLRYAARLSWLLADAEPVCPVAILGDPAALPWRAAAQLLSVQRDFAYVGPDDLAAGRVSAGRIRVGGAAYGAVVVDGMEPAGPAVQRLAALAAAGGVVVSAWSDAVDLDAALGGVPRTVDAMPHSPDLRAAHVRKAGLDLFLLVNEGEGQIRATLRLNAAGRVESWDPMTGGRRALASDGAGGGVDLVLPRRGSAVLAVDPHQGPAVATRTVAAAPEQVVATLRPWRVCRPDGTATSLAPGDWSRAPGFELYSGTLAYRTPVDIPTVVPGQTLVLDLGRVGDLAEVFVDGEPAGVCLWAPHRLALADDGCTLSPGAHQLEVRVTNSMANEYEGAQLPSGLMGPVRLYLQPTRP